MRKHINVAVGLIGFLLVFLLWVFLWSAILHRAGVNDYAHTPIILLITFLLLVGLMPLIGPPLDQWAEAAPERRTLISWLRK
jgi:hypothetical protein